MVSCLVKMKKELMFGNDAVVRGALEAGVAFSTTYPGTPASEIGDIFAKISKKYNFYFEYSTNEKVALEAAAGAAFSGLKSIVSMKHYGLNVALDSLLPLVYFECPLVVVVADDPGCHSSIQTEQDTRWFSRLGKIITLEPSDSQEAKDMTKLAFELSQKYKIPVLVRLTTRISHSKSEVILGDVPKPETKGNYLKKPFELGGDRTVFLHKETLKKMKKLREFSENSRLNFEEEGEGKLGVITTGVSYNYLKEIFEELNINLPLLKIGISYPFPKNKVEKFIKKLDKVFVVEELDSVIENEIKQLNPNMEIHGKDFLPETGEFNPEIINTTLSMLLNKKINIRKKEKVEKRLPFLCAGCPHMATFYSIKRVLGDKKIFGGDIGCYMLGSYPPFNMQDFVVNMGAGIGISHGIAKSTGEKPIIFIGDSTFFHAGIPALINLVYNQSDVLLVILDNSLASMTGQQPHPGTGYTGMDEQSKKIDIEDIVKACQVDFVKTSKTYNINQFMKDVKEAYEIKGVSVLISKGECRLHTLRRITKQEGKIPKYEIIKQDEKLNDLENLGCPAIMKINDRWIIDEDLCWGCTICQQLYPENIKIKK